MLGYPYICTPKGSERMNDIHIQNPNRQLLLKASAISLFVTLSVILIVRIILPTVFSLDETSRQLYFSRVTVVYIMGIIFVIPGTIKRLKEWSFTKTFLIAWATTTLGTLIMALGIIMDIQNL